MDFPDLAPLVTQGAFFSHAHQRLLSDTLEEQVGPHRFEGDLSERRLSFVSEADDARRIDTTAELVATIAPGPRSLLWGWANPQASGSAAGELKAYGERHSMPALTTPELPLQTEATGEALADEISQSVHTVGQAVVGALGRAPYYSVPIGGGTRALFLLSGPDLPRLAIGPALPRYLMEAATLGATADHRTTFHWMAVYAGWQLSWDEGYTTATVLDPQNGSSATVHFTPQALLGRIEMSLRDAV